jgi:monoamine oxidase
MSADNDSTVYDVIIVGAGLSGLSAGYYLMKSNENLKILVIEAKNRVGGRTETKELNCSKIGVKKKWDVGGQWVCFNLNLFLSMENQKKKNFSQFENFFFKNLLLV